jgi:beta-galactosidase
MQSDTGRDHPCGRNGDRHRGGFPGAGLRRLTGVWAEELDGLPDGEEVPLTVAAGAALSGLPAGGRACTYCERLHAEDAEVLATYAGEFYAGEPVLTRRRHGTGWAYHLGARCDQAFLEGLLDALVAAGGLRTLCPERPAPGVWLQERSDGERRYLFVHNATAVPLPVHLAPGRWRDLVTGAAVPTAFTLAGVESRVLTSG